MLALKGPNLDQMTNYLIIDLESQTKPHFHLALSPGQEYYLKISKFYYKGLNLAIFGPNWPKIDPKLVQKGQNHIHRPKVLNKTIFQLNLKSRV